MRSRHMMHALLPLGVLLCFSTAAFAAPDISGHVAIGAGGTETKMQSKVWFNDGAWWAILYAGDWRGTAFPLAPGTGIAIVVRSDLPVWTPHLAQR
jgi:hypothetical protein